MGTQAQRHQETYPRSLSCVTDAQGTSVVFRSYTCQPLIQRFYFYFSYVCGSVHVSEVNSEARRGCWILGARSQLSSGLPKEQQALLTAKPPSKMPPCLLMCCGQTSQWPGRQLNGKELPIHAWSLVPREKPGMVPLTCGPSTGEWEGGGRRWEGRGDPPKAHPALLGGCYSETLSKAFKGLLQLATWEASGIKV